MATPWLLLIHQIPPKPDYFRVKVGRRLQRIGAVAIKNAVYVLPATEQATEEFHRVLREIVESGGEAFLCRAELIGGLTDGDLESLFRAARSRDYEEIAADARVILKRLPAGRRVMAERRVEVESALAKLRRRFAAVARIDFFEPPARRAANEALAAITRRLRPAVPKLYALRQSEGTR